MVTVTVPALFTEVGETEHVVPGSDEDTLQVNATAPVKPFSAVTVTAELPTLPVVPAVSEKLAGDIVTWKSGTTIMGGLTVTAMAAVWVVLPDVA